MEIAPRVLNTTRPRVKGTPSHTAKEKRNHFEKEHREMRQDNMIFSQPLEDVIKLRRSVRSYTDAPISKEIKEKIDAYILTIESPFPTKTTFKFIEAALEPNGLKLGTYGMIKGASSFIGAVVPDTPFGVEALGYEFEQLILFLTTLDLGTCWLGGTFNRGEFQKVMGAADSMLFPAVSPVGYFEKKSLKEKLVRSFIKADARKPWVTLFFDGDFSSPLTEAAAGAYAFPLEMVRLGPSASNKQPWRIVKAGEFYHFYEYKIPGYSSAFTFDMQAIDMGIAACHFRLAAIEKGLKGIFVLGDAPLVECPENVIYKFSWAAE